MDLLLETGLEHQEKPVELIANLFSELGIAQERKYYENPVFDFASEESTATLKRRVERTQRNEGIVDYAGYDAAGDYLSLDIKMETGTGKTYVYTHIMYELVCPSRQVQKTLFQTHTSDGISETKEGTRLILISASLKPAITAARKRREGIFSLAKCVNLWKEHSTTTNESTYFLQTWPCSHQARC